MRGALLHRGGKRERPKTPRGKKGERSSHLSDLGRKKKGESKKRAGPYAFLNFRGEGGGEKSLT